MFYFSFQKSHDYDAVKEEKEGLERGLEEMDSLHRQEMGTFSFFSEKKKIF